LFDFKEKNGVRVASLNVPMKIMKNVRIIMGR